MVTSFPNSHQLTAFQSQSNRGTKRAVSPNHEDEDEPSKKKKKASWPFQLIKNNSPPDRTGIKVQITKRKQNSAKGKWIIVVGLLVLIRLEHKSSSNQDEERPKKRAKISDNYSSPPVRRPVKPDRPTRFQIPQQCPKSSCDESQARIINNFSSTPLSKISAPIGTVRVDASDVLTHVLRKYFKIYLSVGKALEL
ncbi:hypothetical protein K438DRAFT_1765642 [Mycena galopus ATCC 62051]|nr:hypothetical protein K438DRAFT_1765642 [Mycena galopus ATCC 62051]